MLHEVPLIAFMPSTDLMSRTSMVSRTLTCVFEPMRGSGELAYVVGKSYRSSRLINGRFDAETQIKNAFQEQWHSLVVYDLTNMTNADGINWPKRSLVYVILRACSKLPIVREALETVTRCGMGVRFRQLLHQHAIKH